MSENFLYLNNNNYHNNINSSNHRYVNQNTTVNLNEIINETGNFSQNRNFDNNNNKTSVDNNMFKSSSLNNLINNSNNISLNSNNKKITEIPKNILDNFSEENFNYYSRILDFINEEYFKLNKLYIILNKKKTFQTSLDFLNNNGEYLEYNQIISQEKVKYFKLLKHFNDKLNEYNKIKNHIEKYFQYLIENSSNEKKTKEIFEFIINEINNYLIKFNDNNNNNNNNNYLINSNDNNNYNNTLDSNKLRIESINVEKLQFLSDSKRQFLKNNNIKTENEENNNFNNSYLKNLNDFNEFEEELQKKIDENNKKKEINSFYFLYEPSKLNKNLNTNFSHSFFNNKKYKIICDYENLIKENPNVYLFK